MKVKHLSAKHQTLTTLKRNLKDKILRLWLNNINTEMPQKTF